MSIPATPENIVISILILVQGLKWFLTILFLFDNEYISKSEFLLRMIPGYWVLDALRVVWETIRNFAELPW